MRAIVTGINGTVAPVLAKSLRNAGHIVIPWNRNDVPTDNPSAVNDFISSEKPDWFFHLATGSPLWAELIARNCALNKVKILFTSSVSVFSGTQKGPFTIESIPQPVQEYGRYKLECEKRISENNSEALIVRLGWQIGEVPGGNHLLDYLENTFKTEGKIEASINWYQSCSFIDDTAESLIKLMEMETAGLYHLDGNQGINFYEIAISLNRLVNNRWLVIQGEIPDQNNLLIDERIRVRAITERF